MKKKMIVISLLFLAALLAFGISYYFVRIDVLLTLAITFGTCFYHFAMRLVVGLIIDVICRNKINYDRRWFAERRFEPKLYKFLRVKKWKKYLPTFNPEDYDLRKRSVEEIIRTTCRSEIVHEVNMILSFVPVIFTIWFGALAAFLITSSVAFLFDGIFVIMQRFNRPRLRRLLNR